MPQQKEKQLVVYRDAEATIRPKHQVRPQTQASTGAENINVNMAHHVSTRRLEGAWNDHYLAGQAKIMSAPRNPNKPNFGKHTQTENITRMREPFFDPNGKFIVSSTKPQSQRMVMRNEKLHARQQYQPISMRTSGFKIAFQTQKTLESVSTAIDQILTTTGTTHHPGNKKH